MSNNVIIVGKQRKPWVDFLRALAIFLVVYGHQIQPCTPYFVLTSPIKMPLFFAISGYLFTLKPGKEYIKKVVMTLIVPWFLLSLLPVILLIPVRGFSGFLLSVGKVLSGEVAWFMPCFIISSILFYCLMRISKAMAKENKWWGVICWVLVICLAFVGLFLKNRDMLNYAMFNRALTVLPFFMVGYSFKQVESCLEQMKCLSYRWLVFVMAVIYIVSLIFGHIFFPGKSIDVHMVNYFNLPLCFVQILSGVLLMFLLFSRLSTYPQWMLEVGKDSLVIYMWHPFVIALLIKLLEKLHFQMHYMLTGLVVTIIGIFICCILTFFMRRYVPFLIGNR